MKNQMTPAEPPLAQADLRTTAPAGIRPPGLLGSLEAGGVRMTPGAATTPLPTGTGNSFEAFHFKLPFFS